MRITVAAALLILAGTMATARAEPVPGRFESTGADRRAIQALLSTYTTAVNRRDRKMFETILLDKDISFSGTDEALRNGDTRNYASFRKGVFEGPPFRQTFRDIHITNEGPLATVMLVFVNQTPDRSYWGWKTMQLLKLGGHWKIASEFFTGHELTGPDHPTD